MGWERVKRERATGSTRPRGNDNVATRRERWKLTYKKGHRRQVKHLTLCAICASSQATNSVYSVPVHCFKLPCKLDAIKNTGSKCLMHETGRKRQRERGETWLHAWVSFRGYTMGKKFGDRSTSMRTAYVY